MVRINKMKSFIKLTISLCAFSSITLPSLSYAEAAHNHATKKSVSGVESLSPKLRSLLTEEMQALEKGMMSIIPAYAAGNWSEIAAIADKMKNSYILQKSLSNKQIKELHSTLPGSFLKLDQQFHYLSGMLSHAAEMEKSELVGFYFSELSDSCIECHTQYATHKFPTLLPNKKIDEHVH